MTALRENLAAVQHAIWVHWMTYLFSISVLNEDGTCTIPADKVNRWSEQIRTPYSKLPEYAKESDREQADRVLAVFYDDTYWPLEGQTDLA